MPHSASSALTQSNADGAGRPATSTPSHSQAINYSTLAATAAAVAASNNAAAAAVAAAAATAAKSGSGPGSSASPNNASHNHTVVDHHLHHGCNNSSPTGLSSTETLLRNIQSLLTVAADNARQQERQINYEKGKSVCLVGGKWRRRG